MLGVQLWDVNNEASPLKSYSYSNCSNVRFHHKEMLLAATSNNGQNSNIHFIDLESLEEESNCVVSTTKVNSLQFHPEKLAVIAATDNQLIVAGWDPPGTYDSILCNFGRVHSAKAFPDYYLAMCDDDRACGKIMQIDLSKVQLQRPETPQSSGLRKTFDQMELRPNTMESRLDNDSPHSDDGPDSRVEIADINKFAALFNGQTPIERSKSDLQSRQIARHDFDKALNPRQSMDTMIKQPMITRERSIDPVRQSAGAGDPYGQFSAPYRNQTPSNPRSNSAVSRSVSSYSQVNNGANNRQTPTSRSYSQMPSNEPSRRASAGDRNPMRDQKMSVGGILSSSIYDELKHRRENLESATIHWPNVDAVIDNAFALGDQSTIIDLLNVINRRMSAWSLSICAKMLNQTEQCSLLGMFITKQPTTFETLLDSVNLISRHFTPIIFENLDKPNTSATDLQSEERRQRAIVCYESLRQVKSLLQSRSQSEGGLNGKVRDVLIELSDY